MDRPIALFELAALSREARDRLLVRSEAERAYRILTETSVNSTNVQASLR